MSERRIGILSFQIFNGKAMEGGRDVRWFEHFESVAIRSFDIVRVGWVRCLSHEITGF
jgi:hypothetical protein